MSLRLSVCSTTSCQAFSLKAFGDTCPSAAAIDFFSLDFVDDPGARRDRDHRIEAPKLDAIDGIVNMPRSLRDLRFGPMPWVGRCAIKAVTRRSEGAL